MSSCIICYKKVVHNKHVNSENEQNLLLCQRFFTLLERYLLTGKSFKGQMELKSVFKCLSLKGDPKWSRSPSCCPDCFLIIKSFVELFREIKRLELLLSWKLRTITEIMSCAQKVTSRLTTFKESLGVANAELILRNKRKLAKFCSIQLNMVAPKVKLKRLSDDIDLRKEYSNQMVKSPSPGKENWNDIASDKSRESSSAFEEFDSEPRTSPEAQVKGVKNDSITKLAQPEIETDSSQDTKGIMGNLSVNAVGEEENEIFVPQDIISFSEFEPMEEESTDECDNSKAAVGKTAPIPENNESVDLFKGNSSGRLRARHQCQNCKRTFSTKDKLASHQKPGACFPMGPEEHNFPSEGSNNKKEDGDSTDTSSSDEDDFQDDDQGLLGNEEEQSDIEDKDETSNNLSSQSISGSESDTSAAETKPIPYKKHFGDNEIYRYKCPKCDSLFSGIIPFLQHNRKAHQNIKLETGTQSHSVNDRIPVIPVDIAVISNANVRRLKTKIGTGGFTSISSEGIKLSRLIPDSYKQLATVQLPDQLFRCEVPGCPEVDSEFIFEQDLHSHSKLHGKFSCPMCKPQPLNFQYAPEFAKHIKEQHIQELMSSTEGCSQCKKLLQVQVQNPHLKPANLGDHPFETHYLSHHLKLWPFVGTLSRWLCPVCRFFRLRKGSLNRAMGQHLVAEHSLSPGNGSECEAVYKCKVGNCPGYFNTEASLKNHERDHKTKTRPGLRMNDNFLERTNNRKAIKLGTGMKRSGSPNTVNSQQFLLKCPDPSCNKLFNGVQPLLKHTEKQHRIPGSGDGLTVDIIEDNYDSKLFTRIQLPSKLYPCPVDQCGLPFYSEPALDAHRKLHGEFTCAECSFRCDYAPELSAHEVRTHGRCWNPGWYGCSRCEEAFSSTRKAFGHHLTVHLGLTPENLHNCPICKGHYSERNLIKLQISELKEQKTSKILFRHFKEQHDLLTSNSSFKCEEMEDCGAYYLTQQQLDTHKERCHGIEKATKPRIRVREFKCGLCHEHKCFLGRLDLQAHRLRLHRECPELIRCPREPITGIGKSLFGSKGSLERIILNPAGNCCFLFETEEELQEHIGRTHDNPEVKNCPKCDKLFLTKPGLALHLKEHKRKEAGKEKVNRKEKAPPLQCQECGKSFPTKSELKYHSVQHLKPEEWEHLCGVCGKRFKAAHFLRYHMNVHEKKKQFFCQKCPAGYRHHHHLRQHLRDKHSLKGEDIGPTLKQRQMMGLE